jgi:hypothetical protein
MDQKRIAVPVGFVSGDRALYLDLGRVSAMAGFRLSRGEAGAPPYHRLHPAT